MNRNRLQGRFRQFSGQLKEGWGAVVGDPLTVAAGRRDRIAGSVQERRGISQEEADRQLEDFLRRNRNWSNPSRR